MLPNSTLEKIVDVCNDGCLTMFRSQSKFIAKGDISNAVGFHCVIHREALSFRILPIAMKDNLQQSYKVSTTLKQVILI